MTAPYIWQCTCGAQPTVGGGYPIAEACYACGERVEAATNPEWRKPSGTVAERYPNAYRMLKRVGHSPAKAIEILIDARRGDRHALRWVRSVRGLVS